jgi:hypothetical protein
MESQDREQGTPQQRLAGDEPQEEESSEDTGYDSPEDSARQDEEEVS